MSNRDLEAFVDCARGQALAVDGDSDDGSLPPLASVVGGTRVVGMGESQHYVGEFNRFRSRLFRHLVHHHGFTTLVFECGVVEAKCTHDYVLGLHDDRDRAHLGIDSTFGLWRGTQSVVDWMREHNQHCDEREKVRFYGMDGSQGWSGTESSLAYACAFLDEVDPDTSSSLRDTLLPLARSLVLSKVHEAAWDDLRELAFGLDQLETQFRTEAMHYISEAGFDAYDWAQRAIIVAHRISAMLVAVRETPNQQFRIWWNMRDACMAEQLFWILRREGSAARLVVGAHNIHLQKDFARETDIPLTTMGQHLAARLPGNDYVVIAGTSDESLKPEDPARDGSFQSALARMGPRSFLLDLRAINEPLARLWLDKEKPDRSAVSYQPLRTTAAWDAVFYTRTISLDDLRLPASLARAACDPDPETAASIVGTFEFDGVVDDPVELTICDEEGVLVTHGSQSDGELFPIPRSRLHAMSSDAFFWEGWSMELVGERDTNEAVTTVGIRYPGEPVKYWGRRKA